jgi:predicted DNA-binding transcriptional regulator YafY
LHNQLTNDRYPNAKRLADQFEISHRQAQRDIEFMRDSLGAPIEYLFGRKGYCYREPFVLPTYFVDKNDRIILDELSDYYEGLFEMGFERYQGFSDLLKRLSGHETIKPDRLERLPLAPFVATIEFQENRSNFRLIQRFCIEEISNTRKVFEFTNTELFIGLLFSCGTGFRIESPGWLRERIVQNSEKIVHFNRN